MKLEDLENATDTELRKRAMQCFEDAPSPEHLVGTILLRKARFYLDEIDRREDRRIGRRDFRMELIVIVLIGLELITAVGLAIWGERHQSAQFAAQQVVMDHLEKSSQATADTLSALKSTTETMNTAIQNQLALSYDPSVTVKYDPSQKLDVINGGGTNITLVGSKLGAGSAYFLPKPHIMVPAGGYEFDAAAQYQELAEKVQKGSSLSMPFEVYIKNELGVQFVVDCTVTAVWESTGIRIFTQLNAISRRRFE